MTYRTLTAAIAAAILASVTASAQQGTQTDSSHRRTASRAHHRAAPTSQAALRAEARVSMDSARSIAQAEVPDGKISSSELEREKGKLIYSFDIKVAGKPGIEEVNVDALTGQLVAHEHESAQAEQREARADSRAARRARSTAKKAIAPTP
jgi:uncharacterized membrane protein YkoI